MTLNKNLDERGRATENDYFRRQEQAQIERLKQRAAHEATRRQLADRTGIADDNFLDELENAGFTPETVSLLQLVPLVQTAWAEGRVQGLERKAILEVATWRGVTPDHPAFFKLEQWLTDRPSEEFFEKSLRALRFMLHHTTDAERERQASEIVAACVRVARASGGMGFIDLGRRISAEEQIVLERVIGDLKEQVTTPAATTVAL